ncbi:ImmA/IrrE family metallo-endopeptidase [Microbacterium aerolatum]|uniref:ImmA/IrrE family metallo-endopeptidase n=1 Tax=Microbacterium aerolatum TaxID=153731 RepID=UPI00384BCC7C
MTRNIRAAAEEEAERILADYWDVNEVPVNPVAIAKRLGAEVYTAQLPSDVSGIFQRDADLIDKIYLDSDDSVARQRFTAAHEIGHLLRVPEGDTAVRIERRDTRATTGRDPEEVFANSFSAALLMPRSVIRRLLAANVSRAVIAKSLRVSQEALNNRIDNLSRDGKL